MLSPSTLKELYTHTSHFISPIYEPDKVTIPFFSPLFFFLMELRSVYSYIFYNLFLGTLRAQSSLKDNSDSYLPKCLLHCKLIYAKLLHLPAAISCIKIAWHCVLLRQSYSENTFKMYTHPTYRLVQDLFYTYRHAPNISL